jgi:hypothetical protein
MKYRTALCAVRACVTAFSPAIALARAWPVCSVTSGASSVTSVTRSNPVSGLHAYAGNRFDDPTRDRCGFPRGHHAARTHVAYVVIDTGLCSPELIAFAKRAFGLTPVAVDRPFELYRTVGH